MKIIGIYPGNFQPPTKAHFKAYEYLKRISREDTFVATTDRNPIPEAPLNYGDKEQIWVRHGVADSNIVKVVDWRNPIEILRRFDEKLISVVFALNRKEAQEMLTKDPKHFLLYKGNKNLLQPSTKLKYIVIIDDSKIENREITTADISKVLGSSEYDNNTKKKFFRFVFGWFDISLYTLISAKFKQSYQSTHSNSEIPEPQIGKPQEEPLNPSVKSSIQKMVREVLGEIMNEVDEAYDVNINDPKTSAGNTSTDTTDTTTNPAKQKQDLVKQKQALELQAKQNKQQRDQYATTVKNYDQIKKKSDRDAITAVNKQISQPPTTTTSTNITNNNL